MNLNERKFYKKYLNEVLHATLNPYEPGVVRIHLIPAKYEPFKADPSVVILNGKDILPINLSWTILLAIFIKEVNKYKGKEVDDKQIDVIIENTVKKIKKVYKREKEKVFKDDLNRIISTFMDISKGKETDEKIGLDETGKPQGNSCMGWKNDQLIGEYRVLYLTKK